MTPRALLIILAFLLPHQVNALESPKFSLSHRLRIESWNSSEALPSQFYGQTYTRQRTSLGATWKPITATTLGVKLTNEFRYWLSNLTPFSRDEIVFDNFYVKYEANLWRPIALTVGRQDLMLGEGWLVMDGTPLDGSRTAYFNAIRLDVKPEAKTAITGFYVFMDQEDRALPIFKNNHKQLTEQHYEGGGVWAKRDWTDYSLNLYYLEKNDRRRKYSRGFNYLYPKKIWTSGIRGEYNYNGNLHLTAEGAIQQGEIGGNETYVQSYGFIIKLKRDLPRRVYLPAYIAAGEVMMRGDDPRIDSRYEGWDPMWGRWPKWSEAYVYLLANEGGIGRWSNYRSIFGETNYRFSPSVDLTLQYQFVWAVWGGPSPAGIDRGIMTIGKLNYQIDEHWAGHFLWERFEPGDFYLRRSGWNYQVYEARPFAWIRFELMYKI